MTTKFPASQSWHHLLCGTVSTSTMCCDPSNHHSSGTFNKHSNLCLFHYMLAVLVECCENDKRHLCRGKLLALIQTHKIKQQSPLKNCSLLWDNQSQQHRGTKKCQWLQIVMQGIVGKFFCACTWLVFQVSNTRWQNQLHNPKSTICQYKVH